MKIKVLLLQLFSAVCLSLLFFGVTNASFIDIASSKYQNAINYLNNRGIVEGYSDGTFRPKAILNRAELLKIIVGAFEISSNINQLTDSFAGKSCFKDVPANAWYTKYVCYAKSQNIVKGYSDGTFKPGQNIINVEAYKILLKTFQVNIEESTPWYANIQNYITFMYKIPEEDPSGLLNREVMADLITRLLLRNEGKLDAYLANNSTGESTDSSNNITSTTTNLATTYSYLTPRPGQNFTGKQTSIFFSWSPALSGNYNLTIEKQGSNGAVADSKNFTVTGSSKYITSDFLTEGSNYCWYINTASEKFTNHPCFEIIPNIINPNTPAQTLPANTNLTTPILTQPANSTTISPSTTNILFQWQPVNGATSYDLLIGKNGEQPTSYYVGNVTQYNINITSLYPANGQNNYVWQIKANSPDQVSYTMSNSSFFYYNKTITLSKPVLIQPINDLVLYFANFGCNGNTCSNPYKFSWTAVPNATSYVIHIRNDGIGTPDELFSQTTSLTYFDFQDWYHLGCLNCAWKVDAIRDGSTTMTSAEGTFQISSN